MEELEDALVELKGIQSLDETRMNIMIGSVGLAAIWATALVWLAQLHENLVERTSALMASTLMPSQELLDIHQDLNDTNWGYLGIPIVVGMAAIAIHFAEKAGERRSDNIYMIAKMELKIKRLQAQSKPVDFRGLIPRTQNETTPRRKNGPNRRLQSMKKLNTFKHLQ